ncbi:MAG TPA: hypothetical protein VGF75_03565 [Candidatus Saccharimonadales bacterium]|jgi:hypothetical protein
MTNFTGPFRDPETNKWLTACLFHEPQMEREISARVPNPPYMLYGTAKGKVSCQDTFLEVGDPTGLKWAEKYIGGYNHFTVLLKSTWFKEAFDYWNEQLAKKNEQEALEIIKEISKDETSKARFQAAKFMVDYSTKKATPSAKRGRPTQEEVTGELKKEMEARKSTSSDAERIGLKVILGGKS